MGQVTQYVNPGGHSGDISEGRGWDLQSTQSVNHKLQPISPTCTPHPPDPNGCYSSQTPFESFTRACATSRLPWYLLSDAVWGLVRTPILPMRVLRRHLRALPRRTGPHWML
jgi:hypothetical protein